MLYGFSKFINIMFRIISSFILSLFFIFSCSNKNIKNKDIESKNVKRMSLCQHGARKAKEDFEKGKYYFTSYGLSLDMLIKKYKYDTIYDSILLNDYKIIKKKGGCTFTDRERCYGKEMSQLVKNKYGQNYKDGIKSKALEIYIQTDEYLNDILPATKGDSIFRRIKPMEIVSHNTRKEMITNHIFQNLDKVIYDSLIMFDYVLEKNGTINLQHIKHPIDSFSKIKVEKALTTLPKLPIALHFTQPVRYKSKYSNK